MELSKEQVVWIENEVYATCPIQYREDTFCDKRKRSLKEYRERLREFYTQKILKSIVDMNTKNIQGVEINIDSFKAVKSIADLKKQDIFSHLENADEAYKELFELIKPKKVSE
jgi:vacuolar-type H+-ATPase subunit D/Vma8